jgi:acetyltransferase-like isoleucine patch superfamily enzyme
MIKFYIFKLLSLVYKVLKYSYKQYNCLNYKKKYQFSSTVSLGEVILIGKNISIGKNTYINSGLVQVGNNAKISIGEWCAIGYNVTILAIKPCVDRFNCFHNRRHNHWKQCHYWC